ncbi:MAG TPA: hypothetical protein VF576_05090, partial [Rubricoccaceae bacterium]
MPFCPGPVRLLVAFVALLVPFATSAQSSEPDALARAGVAPAPVDDLTAAATPCVSGFAGVYSCSNVDL